MGAVILFVDGVGLGDEDPTRNPLAAVPMPALHTLLGGQPLTRAAVAPPAANSEACLVAVDATLGVDGLPQSGTGQATLWSGVNVAVEQGRHSGPYAPPLARDVLAEHNLFADAQGYGPVAFANAFPPRYLARLTRGTARQSVTGVAARLAGLPFRGPAELARGEAISAFVTNEMWESHLGVAGMPVLSAREAGHRLARLAQSHALTVFEYFATDMAGHRGEAHFAHDVLARLDGLLAGLVDALDPTMDLLLVISDHGNLEDTTTTDHTLNPVPGLVWGNEAGAVASRLVSLMDVTPSVLRWLAQTYST